MTSHGIRDRDRTTVEDDDATLHALGYPRKLSRRMNALDNFGVSFTIISILSGCLTLYGFGMNTGGPAAMIWGWAGVGLFTLFVGLSMAEVTSAYPTSGALYYYSAKLAKKNKSAWAWYTGWFNLLGQVAVTAGIDFGASQFIGAFAAVEWGFTPTPKSTIGIFAGVLVLHGLLNTFGVRLVALLNRVSVVWHLLGVTVIVVALAVVPKHHQSVSFVFTHFVNNTGWHSVIYVGALSLLMAQYTFTGYDASAHMSEETKGAAVSAPKGIVRSIWVSWIAGFVLLVGVTFAIQNYNGELASSTGVPPAQIFIDALGQTGGLALLLIAIVAQLFCGMSSVTANSRMIFAFSGRDRAIPGHQLWYKVNSRTGTPTNSVWLAVVAAFVIALPYLYSPTAYAAVTSIATIGLYLAYIIPVILRLRLGKEFVRGPWHLGRWSTPIGIIATVWVVFITVLFLLPESSPVTVNTFNYAPIAVGTVLLLATIWWFVTARRQFTGPVSYGSPEELAALESELM